MAGIESPTTGNGQEVDTAMKAARTTLRPMECLGWLSVGAVSGALTGAAANTPIFSFRNLSANPVLIRRVGIGFIASTGFTAAQMLSYGLIVARAFTVSDSGGTAISLTGSNAKHRTSLAGLTSVDMRIAAAAALTAGTRALDVTALAQIGAWAPLTAGVVLAPAPNNLLSHDAGDYPLVLAQNEGVIITNVTAMGAGGVGTFFTNLEMAEVTTY